MEAEGFLDFIKGNADPDSVSASQFSKGQAFHCFLHNPQMTWDFLAMFGSILD
ncbi:MAG: hypothetical protein ACK5NI_00840 [bacterium]